MTRDEQIKALRDAARVLRAFLDSRGAKCSRALLADMHSGVDVCTALAEQLEQHPRMRLEVTT